ncbi:MAG: hypothetical protein ACKVWR_18425 [Acidimicrobiales bacterium]
MPFLSRIGLGGRTALEIAGDRAVITRRWRRRPVVIDRAEGVIELPNGRRVPLRECRANLQRKGVTEHPLTEFWRAQHRRRRCSLSLVGFTKRDPRVQHPGRARGDRVWLETAHDSPKVIYEGEEALTLLEFLDGCGLAAVSPPPERRSPAPRQPIRL